MTTHHPHPNDPKSGRRQSDHIDTSTDVNRAAQDVRMMQTRLADLLDQVSVTDTPFPTESDANAESDASAESGSSSDYVEPNDLLDAPQEVSGPSLFDDLPSESALFSSPFSDPSPSASQASNQAEERYSTEFSSPDSSFGRPTFGESGRRRGDDFKDEVNRPSDGAFHTNGNHSFLESASTAPLDKSEQSGLSEQSGQYKHPDEGGSNGVSSSIGSFASIGSSTEARDHSAANNGIGSLSAGGNVQHEFVSPTKPNSEEHKRADMPDESSDSGLGDELNHSLAASEPANSAITIKGRTDGIAIEVGAGSWRMLMAQLSQRLQQSSGFFRGGTVSLDVGERALTDDELTAAKEILNEHGLNLTLIRSTSEETSLSSSALGVAVTLDKVASDDSPEGAVSQTALTNHDALEHFVYRGNLRSGQILRRSETILILGDVNPGSHVESEGDILVWGRLRGIAHAGAKGDSNAIVSAMLMEPTQLRISDSIAIMPTTDERRSLFGVKKRNPDLAPRPEVAYIAGDTIVVEPWDESKPGGIMAFRRS